MDFGQAWDDAGAILTLLALLPAAFITLVMTQNIGNSEFDMFSAFEAGVEVIVGAVIPALGATFILALFIYAASNSSGR